MRSRRASFRALFILGFAFNSSCRFALERSSLATADHFGD
jgi:hypothetical protein